MALDRPCNEDHWDTEQYANTARFVSDYGAELVELLQPRFGERVLDIGCGDGWLSLRIQSQGADVVGMDASPKMVEATRGRGIEARLGRAEELDFRGEFDAVFSNAVLHWVPKVDAALRGAARALRAGGRLVVEMGGSGNVDSVRRALASELNAMLGANTDLTEFWYFPTVAEHSKRLATAGFRLEQMHLFSRPTRIDAGMKRWLETLAAPILAMVPGEARDEFTKRVVARLESTLRTPDGRWTIDYVRLRYRARLAGSAP